MLELEVKKLMCEDCALFITEALRDSDVRTWVEVARRASRARIPGSLDPQSKQQAITAAGDMLVPVGPH